MAEKFGRGAASPGRPGQKLGPELELVLIQHLRATEGRMAVAHELEKASALFLDVAYVAELLRTEDFKSAFEYLLPFLQSLEISSQGAHDSANQIKLAILKHWILELIVTYVSSQEKPSFQLFPWSCVHRTISGSTLFF